MIITIILPIAGLIAVAYAWIEHHEPRKPKQVYYRHDESLAPLAPRSRRPFGDPGPTKRQIAENDLPRYADEL